VVLSFFLPKRDISFDEHTENSDRFSLTFPLHNYCWN